MIQTYSKTHTRKLWVGYLFIILAAAVFFSAQTSVNGNSYYRVATEIRNLDREHTDLQEQIIARESLTQLSAQVEERGFIEPASIVFVKEVNGLASR